MWEVKPFPFYIIHAINMTIEKGEGIKLKRGLLELEFGHVILKDTIEDASVSLSKHLGATCDAMNSAPSHTISPEDANNKTKHAFVILQGQKCTGN